MIGCDRKVALVAGGENHKPALQRGVRVPGPRPADKGVDGVAHDAQFGIILVVDRRAVVRAVVAAERNVDYQRFAIGFGIIDKSFYGEKDVGVGA